MVLLKYVVYVNPAGQSNQIIARTPNSFIRYDINNDYFLYFLISFHLASLHPSIHLSMQPLPQRQVATIGDGIS